MTERTLPTRDAFATCPNHGKILEYYGDTFEAVYVQLHPFIKTMSIHRDQFDPAIHPDRSTIVERCSSISWADVILKTGLPSIAAVDIGLLTRIGALKAEFSNQEYADRIEALAESDQIFPAPEGCFSDMLHGRTLSAIQSLGYEWVWVGDEFGTERKLHWIEDLKRPESKVIEGRCNVFTADKALLWTTHWDSHFSFLCSSKRNLNDMNDMYKFEGFFCTPSTEVHWSVQS